MQRKKPRLGSPGNPLPPYQRNPVLTSWAAVVDYCSFSVRGDVERFHVLYLDRKNRLISDERMGVGTVDHVPVYPREVIKRALFLGASALILVHNHPSGDPTPSEADLAMTKEVQKGCRFLGLTLHDQHHRRCGPRSLPARAWQDLTP